jgi:peptidoglycan/LPS O-acetylase OafA/YrhL
MPPSARPLTRLGRVTSSGRFLPEIDGIRFVAIASVLLFHASGRVQEWSPVAAGSGDLLGRLFAGGDAGVRIFFVLSGFIIALPFAEAARGQGPRPSLRAYYLRRVTRLEPPYLINLAVLALLLATTGAYPPRTVLAHLVPSLAYQHGAVFGTFPLVNFVAWSLEVEIQFYVLAPLFAGVFRLPRGACRGLLIAVVVAGSVLDTLWPGPPRWRLTLGPYVHWFAAGFFLADLQAGRDGTAGRSSWRWDLAGALAWVALAPLRLHGTLYPLVYPAVATAAVAAVLRGGRLGAIFRRPWVTTVGGMCYTIYLWHPTVIENAGRLTIAHPLFASAAAERLVQVAGLAALAVVAAIPAFLLFEKPFMFRDWPSRCLRDPKSVWLRAGVLYRSIPDRRI